MLIRLLLFFAFVLPGPVYAGVLATDNFDRADNADLGANWTPNIGTMKIATNTAKPSSGSADSGEFYSGLSWPADQYSKVTLATVSTSVGAGTGYGVSCRADTGGANTLYRLVARTAGYELGRNNAGAFTSITISTGTTFADGDILELRCTGSSTVTLRMYKNGVQFGGDQTDSTGSRLTSGAAGMYHSGSTSAGTANDNWEGGSLGGGNRQPIIFQ